jgi:hypothetical protein
MGMRFADLSVEFCDSAVCPGARSGVLVYRDENHVTTAFAAGLMPTLRDLVEGPLVSRAASGSYSSSR